MSISSTRGKSVSVIGAIDSFKGLLHYYIFEGSNNSNRFSHFLNGFLPYLDESKHYLVLDNLSIHRSKKIQDIIAIYPSCQMLFLPGYSSKLNPIELLWNIIKS